MDVEFLILADAAEVVNQKLYLLGGGWNSWNAAQYPAQANFAVALSLLVPWEETNEKRGLAVALVDPEGKTLVEMRVEVEVGRPPGTPPGRTQRAILAVPLSVPLAKPGPYEVRAGGEVTTPRSVAFDAFVRLLPLRL